MHHPDQGPGTVKGSAVSDSAGTAGVTGAVQDTRLPRVSPAPAQSAWTVGTVLIPPHLSAGQFLKH